MASIDRLVQVLEHRTRSVVQVLLYGIVAVAVVLPFFLGLGYVIESEKLIRKLIGRFRQRPSIPVEPTRHHKYFDLFGRPVTDRTKPA